MGEMEMEHKNGPRIIDGSKRKDSWDYITSHKFYVNPKTGFPKFLYIVKSFASGILHFNNVTNVLT